MFEYERPLWAQGMACVAGIDEAGRGCLFGDVVAAAVILPEKLKIEGIDDSKKLSETQRKALYSDIMDQALAVGIGRVDSETIDQINIKQAARLAMKLATEALDPQPEYILVDAEEIKTAIPQLAVIKGDQRSQSIAAASIVAKVTRDRLCLEWDRLYPEYGISLHKGYATKRHREMIRTFGPSPMHRRSFLSNIINIQQKLF